MATVMQMHPFSICLEEILFSYTKQISFISYLNYAVKRSGTVVLLWDIVLQCSLCENNRFIFWKSILFIGTCYAREICVVLCCSSYNELMMNSYPLLRMKFSYTYT
jgi:hypothetical protein